MVGQGIQALTGTRSVADAWRVIISPADVVGIKVYSLPGNLSGTRKPVVEGVLQGILQTGIPSTNIVIWDKHTIDLRQAGFFELAAKYNVRVSSSAECGYDYSVYYESPIIGNLVWGDFDFGRSSEGMGRKSYVSKLLTRELTKLISISPLLNHNAAGVAGHLYSLAIGSADNTTRFEYDQARLAQAVPEIFATPAIADKTTLHITDALICQYEGSERALLHYSVTPNELWFSKDPVALDTLALDEVLRQRDLFVSAPPRPNRLLYSNAALLELGVNETNKMRILRTGNR